MARKALCNGRLSFVRHKLKVEKLKTFSRRFLPKFLLPLLQKCWTFFPLHQLESIDILAAMYRQAVKVSSATMRAATLRVASRQPARLALSKISARSYSSGGSHGSSEGSSSFGTYVTYAAPTLLAVAGYWAFIDRPYKNKKAANSAAHKAEESAKEVVEESVVEEVVEETPIEAVDETLLEAVTSVAESVEEGAALAEEVVAEAVGEAGEEIAEVVEEISETAGSVSEAVVADIVEAISEGIAEGEEVLAVAEGSKPPSEDDDKKREGAFNPETGEINWDCPCLGGMANGPCGEEFKTAFSCFVYSEGEPKGIDCIEKFAAMQECFKQHPDVYAEELAEAEPFPEDKPEESTISEAVAEPAAEEPKAEVETEVAAAPELTEPPKAEN